MKESIITFHGKRFGKSITGKKTGRKGIHVLVTKSDDTRVPVGLHLCLFNDFHPLSGRGVDSDSGSLIFVPSGNVLTIELTREDNALLAGGKALYNRRDFKITANQEAGDIPREVLDAVMKTISANNPDSHKILAKMIASITTKKENPKAGRKIACQKPIFDEIKKGGWKQGDNVTALHRKLQRTLGEQAPSLATVRTCWCAYWKLQENKNNHAQPVAECVISEEEMNDRIKYKGKKASVKKPVFDEIKKGGWKQSHSITALHRKLLRIFGDKAPSTTAVRRYWYEYWALPENKNDHTPPVAEHAISKEEMNDRLKRREGKFYAKELIPDEIKKGGWRRNDNVAAFHRELQHTIGHPIGISTVRRKWAAYWELPENKNNHCRYICKDPA